MSEGAPCRQPRPGTYLVCRPTEEHHTQRVGLLLPAHSRRRFSHWIHHLPLHVAPAHATVFAPSDPVSTKTPLPIVHGQQRGGVRGARVETTEVWRQQCKGHCTAMPIPHRQPFERREMDHVEGIRGAPQHTTRQSGDQPTIRLCKRRPSTAGDGGLPRWLLASPQVGCFASAGPGCVRLGEHAGEDRGPRAMLSPVAEHDLLCSRVPLAAALGHSGLGSVEVMFALHSPAGCTVVQQPMHCRRLSRVAAPCVRCYCVRSLRWAWPIRRVISKSG